MHNVVMYALCRDVCTMSCMYAQYAPSIIIRQNCTMSCMYAQNSAKQVRIQTNHKLLIPQLHVGCLYTCTIVHSTHVDRYCHTHILFIYTHVQYNTQYEIIYKLYINGIYVLKKTNRTISGVVYDGICECSVTAFRGQWAVELI